VRYIWRGGKDKLPIDNGAFQGDEFFLWVHMKDVVAQVQGESDAIKQAAKSGADDPNNPDWVQSHMVAKILAEKVSDDLMRTLVLVLSGRVPQETLSRTAAGLCNEILSELQPSTRAKVFEVLVANPYPSPK